MKEDKVKKYHFYLARCSDNSLYAGYCADLKQRENKHNSGDGAKYTRQRRPVKIVYSEEFDSISKAMKREAQIKGWKKEKKEELAKKN
ncbi:MAG: GIY-YIG nuclease family protein [Candidatus Komeilibacteria bacterium]|jgi:predicted GIY-YIG superfamily endonuclease|nr:GIY-YIG nuclease family protein [Candidatus Komeilibacteria bacterium]MBT4447805.1 GIY-YIG nuclease family protein [Candidatus Komeilibacteria bacterium]